MKAIRFPLKPLSHHHFGEIALDEKSNLATTSAIPHSDTLFSALVNSFAKIGSKTETDQFVSEFEDGKTVVSSMFYYLEIDGKIIYFLPVPLSYYTMEIKNRKYKKVKKIEFISVKAWETIQDVNDFLDKEKCLLIQDKFVVCKDELDTEIVKDLQVYNKINQPKNPIRMSENEEASIYFQTDVEIADNSKLKKQIQTGFYFLYEAENDENLKKAVKILSLDGIGGGRSTGTGELGQPVYSDDFPIGTGKSKNYCSLSLIVPSNQDEFEQVHFYKTLVRGGRKMMHGKQKHVMMIKEGAIIKSEINGKLVQLGTDAHENRVLRNGKSFLLPINIPEND